jgi:hypothetical protein
MHRAGEEEEELSMGTKRPKNNKWASPLRAVNDSNSLSMTKAK